MFPHLARLPHIWHHQFQSVKEFLVPENEKRQRGRPPVNSVSINLRLPPEMLAWLDAERAKLDPEPSRPEFVRRALNEWLQKKNIKTGN